MNASARHGWDDEHAETARRFFALSADFLCVAGADGYLRAVNPALTRTFGYTEQELLSRPYLDFVHPHDRSATVAAASRIARGSDAAIFHNRCRCKDGSYKWLAWTARAALPRTAIFANARDVTSAMRRDNTSERRLRVRREQGARVRSALDSDALRIVLQPIVDLHTGSVAGLEALSRFSCTPAQSTDAWFADAEAAGLGCELELRAVKSALTTIEDLPAHAFLSINASPATILCDEFHAALESAPAHRLVIEVTEHAAVADHERFAEAIGRLRERGVRLAVDDAGSGYSGLNQIVNLRPDFIKLDIFLTRDIASDCVKRALATAMLGFADEVDATIIAEGAENAETVRALEVLGVDYVQGYYFGLPQPVGAIPDEVALDGVGLPARRGWLDPPPDEALATARMDRLTVASARPGVGTAPLRPRD